MKWIYTKEPIKDFLNRKGLNTKKKQKAFFDFKPSDLRRNYKDLELVVSAIVNAIKTNKNITVYGDYDADGVNATVIILRALKRLNVNANYFINHRFNEGYGMNVKGVTHLLEKFPNTEFIITCDNGIAAQEGIQFALDKGIEVVCTDHHRQNGEIIIPTVDEWREDEDVEAREECCGAEIARRVMMSVHEELGSDDNLEDLITFSGIATIADVVKFTPANHYIAKRGLELLNNPVYPVIELLLKAIKVQEVDEETVGFQIAPLYNALSRVTGESDLMVQLLLRDKATLEAYQEIEFLINTNTKRKEMTEENVKEAYANLNEDDDFIIVTGHYDPGIAGLVCSTLVETYNKPVICLSDNGDMFKGSARSYRDFDLKAALDTCSDILGGYGGHAGAAGLTLPKENLQEFKKRMNEEVRKSGVLEEEPSIVIDYETSIDNVYDETIAELMSFAPFGNGFEKPVIAYKGEFKNVILLPKKDSEKKHVSFKICGQNRTIGAIWFNAINKWQDFVLSDPDDEITVLATPKYEVFNGYPSYKLFINEIK